MHEEMKSWLEVEMEETMTLLRKKLEELNNLDVDHLNEDDVRCMKDIYKVIYYIKTIRKLPQ